MPSTATITSSDLYEFVSSTKAKAEQVNSNFNIWRGNIIPVDASLSSAVNDFSYGLGSSEYRWGESYIRSINFGDTAAAWKLQGSTTVGSDFDFLYNGSTVASLYQDGTMNGLNINWNQIDTTNRFTNGSIDAANTSTSATYVDVSNGSLGVSCTGGPILLFISYRDEGSTRFGTGTSTSDINCGIRWIRDTTTSVVSEHNVIIKTSAFETLTSDALYYLPFNYMCVDEFPTAGSHTYKLQVKVGSDNNITLDGFRVNILQL